MIGFASGPMGPEANNLNPTTFLSYREDRKCERFWTLPNAAVDYLQRLMRA